MADRIPTGFIDSPFRERDFDFGIHEMFGSTPVGTNKFLHEKVKHGQDQHWTQSCTSFGGGQVIHINFDTLGVPKDQNIFPSVNATYLQSRSRKWGYDNIFDVGSALHDFWEGCMDYGLVSDLDVPFDPNEINSHKYVGRKFYRKASDRDWLRYRWILDPPGSRSRRVRQTIDAGLALTVAVELDLSFRQWQLSHGPWSRKYSRDGSHLMAICGYEPLGVWVANSHGPDFGEGGLILIDWSYIEHPECRGFSTAQIDEEKIESLFGKAIRR